MMLERLDLATTLERGSQRRGTEGVMRIAGELTSGLEKAPYISL